MNGQQIKERLIVGLFVALLIAAIYGIKALINLL